MNDLIIDWLTKITIKRAIIQLNMDFGNIREVINISLN